MKHFSYDPFSHIPKEKATARALRQRVTGRDTSIRSTRKGPAKAHAVLAQDLGNFKTLPAE
jgi:hypothetical protein